MIDIKQNVPLAPYTVFKVGGPAAYFCVAKSKDEFLQAAAWAKEKKLPLLILGLGSNALISDRGFAGLVIKMELRDLIILPSECVRAAAGATMAETVQFALQNNLVGFEWAIGVPGTIGGSVRGNAGCFGCEMKDVVKEVKVFDVSAGGARVFTKMDCHFHYRESVFKHNPELVVLSAMLQLSLGDATEARKRLTEYSKKRVTTQEVGVKTAGSMFKNIKWEGELPSGVQFAGSGPRGSVSVGYLIDAAGLKGTKIGGAMVSNKHANFIINTGDATAEDIVMLVALIKERVHRTYGVQLEEEIQYVGFG